MKKLINGSISSPKGYTAAGIAAGLKASGKVDLALIHSDVAAQAVGAFTSNRLAAAPVQYCREILQKSGSVRSIVINSGNANSCTGLKGKKDVTEMAECTARSLEGKADEVLVSSTGIIGCPLPMANVSRGIALAAKALSDDGGLDAARAIMTTDTVQKSLAVEVGIGKTAITIGGIAKGAGMLAPKLLPAELHATMLAYITTDALIEPDFLADCLRISLDKSFNRITVDGDTSTNDTFIVLANGRAENPIIASGTPEGSWFQDAFNFVAGTLARMMVTDGEGATKFIELHLGGARSSQEAHRCADAIANSVLCKTAWFGADPNWGRILDVIGYSGVEVDPTGVNVDYDGLPIVRNSMDSGAAIADRVAILKKEQFQIDIDLGIDAGDFTVWTCDLSHDYVKINADYHT